MQFGAVSINPVTFNDAIVGLQCCVLIHYDKSVMIITWHQKYVQVHLIVNMLIFCKPHQSYSPLSQMIHEIGEKLLGQLQGFLKETESTKKTEN